MSDAEQPPHPDPEETKRLPSPDAAKTPDALPVTVPMQKSKAPASLPSTPGHAKPSPSHYVPELPLAEELQALMPPGEYVIESFHGQGGMGAVYKGLQMPLRRPVAIKVLAKRGGGEEDEFAYEERFKREAYAMAALTHPHIVQVYDCGNAGEHFLFISMEFVEGGDLSAAIKEGRLTTDTVLKLIPQICAGMQAAHEHGLVHRDIKPGNIFLTKDGRAKVADFGLAKRLDSKSTFVTKTGMGMGTPDYAAPEQYEAVSDLDHRADIYSLGVMMYQMLTGRLPRGTTYKAPSQLTGVDPRIDSVVARAMATEREERYQSTAEIAADLAAIMSPATRTGPAPTITRSVPTWTASRMTSAVPLPQPAISTPRPGAPPQPQPQTPRAAAAPASRRAAPPTQKQGRTGIYMIAGGTVAALALGAWWMLKPKESGNATVPSPASASAPVLPTPAEPWQNLMADATLVSSSGLRWNGPSLEFAQGRGLLSPTPFRDGAVRIRAVYTGPTGCALSVRGHGSSDRYSLRVAGARSVTLYRVLRGEATDLRDFTPPQPFTEGRAYQLELRIVDATLTALLDGVVLGTHSDSALRDAGSFGVSNYSPSAFAIRGLEVLEIVKPITSAPPASPAPVASGSGPWQPLFTDEEWNRPAPGKREVVNGRMHGTSTFVEKPQPGADGAMRARIQYQNDSKSVGLRVREGKTGSYRLSLMSPSLIRLSYYPGHTNPEQLGSHTLPKPLHPGDTLLLELRMEGDRLTALVDGATVLEARDTRAPGPGKWGLQVTDGWYESAEVQTLLPAVSVAAEGWEDLLAQLTTEVVAQTGNGWRLEGGALRCDPAKRFAMLTLPGSFVQASYQVRMKLRQMADSGFYLALPVGDRMVGFELDGYNGGASGLSRVNNVPSKELPGNVQGRQVNDSGPHGLEVTVRLEGANAKISAMLDARPLCEWTGPTAGLTQTAVWATTPPGSLALGATLSDWEVSELKVKRLAAPDSAAATKATPFINSLGMKFVPVPIVGGPTAGKTVLFSVWETRVQDYEVFVTETKRGWRKPDFAQGPTHPSGELNWDDAQAFCAWLTERERKAGKLGANERYRLPSDHEWSCAVGIGEREDAATLPSEKDGKIDDAFPWGSAWPPPDRSGNYSSEEKRAAEGKDTSSDELPGYRDGAADLAPVGSYAPNRVGLFDLGGNVWEWCEDWFNAAQSERSMRGASYGDHRRRSLLSSGRFRRPPVKRQGNFGFRCVLEVAPRAEAAAATNSAPAVDSAATKAPPFINSLGMQFLPVPITGGPTAGKTVLFSIWHTRRQDYALYIRETQRSWMESEPNSRPTHPVTVSWEDATAFCAWLTEHERKAGKIGADQVYRLPTDHEWSCAAGLGDREDPETLPNAKSKKLGLFPWGTQWPPPERAGNYAGDEIQPAIASGTADHDTIIIAGYNDGFAHTSPVGSFAANPFGLHDMSGNLWQWCQDWHDSTQSKRVMRGGSWSNGERNQLLLSCRYMGSPSGRAVDRGFRIVLAPTAPAANASAPPSSAGESLAK